MSNVLFALFDRAWDARKAADELLARGYHGDEISVLLRSAHPRREPQLEGDLNPALDDYPRGPGSLDTQFSSAPPSAKRDYNPALDRDDYAEHYEADVQKEMEAEAAKEALTVPEMPEEAPEQDAIEPQAAVLAAEEQDDGATQAKGVAARAGLGLGVGAAAALAAMLVPGIGFVLGGGALAGAVVMLAGTQRSPEPGAKLERVLADQGMAEDSVDEFTRVFNAGGAILALHVTDPERRSVAEELVRKHGARLMSGGSAFIA